MRKALGVFTSVSLFFSSAVRADNPFEFFEEELKVISASRAPVKAAAAPATVHVLTGEEIRFSGARNVWDALRLVPGVDVMTTRAGQGEVGIRGLNGPLSNKTLVMLDGRSVLNGYFDFMIWEELPVSVEEIDRIEVVEGPASSLYGGNALSGVIHIITKTPDQLKGGLVSYAGGERKAHQATAVYGGRSGPVSYKASTGYRSAFPFMPSGAAASKVPKGHFWVGRDLEGGGLWSVSAGGASVNSGITTGTYGIAVPDGPVTFLKTDLEKSGWKLKAHWNRSRILARDYSLLGSPNLDFDSYETQGEKTLVYGPSTTTTGVWYRRNTMTSRMFQAGRRIQNRWAFFAETAWGLWDRLTLTVGVRRDHHPFTGEVFSPRGALVWSPSDSQTVRLSGGSSFRNPTLLENYILLPAGLANNAQTDPDDNFPAAFKELNVLLTGNRDMDPEKMTQYEVSHRGRWGRVSTSAAAFTYEISDVSVATTPTLRIAPPTPPVAYLASSFANGGVTRAWGGEFGADVRVSGALTAFANVSGLDLKDDPSTDDRDEDAPKWKVNAGLRLRAGKASAGVTSRWVTRTRVDGYFATDAYLGWRLAGGDRESIDLFASGTNLGGKRHLEAPVESYGEMVDSRVMGGIVYRF